MSFRTVSATLLTLATISIGECLGQGGLEMGITGVSWEASTDTGPLLFREVPEADLVSVTAKISTQTAGLWSRSGVIVRAPNLIDAAPMQENWVASTSWRGNFTDLLAHRATVVTNGAQVFSGNQPAVTEDMSYLRLDRVGAGQFLSYRGVGPDDAHITWTPHTVGAQTNANLAGITLQVGVEAGSQGVAGSVIWDWVQIQTTSQTYRDDFNYSHDFSVGVPGFNGGATSGGAIWNGVENATAGGVNTTAGQFVCTTCTWSRNGSGDFNDGFNWNPQIASAPNGNTVAAVFSGSADPAVVYTNKNVVLKQIDFDDDDTYVLSGTGSFTLDADAGNALINVLQGSHQIQADVILNDSVTVTTAAGTTLNINAPVKLNNHTWTNVGAGTVNCNNNPSCFVSVGGGGAVVNDGNLSGLVSLGSDFAQTAGGTLAINVGGAPIQIDGGAHLDGVLDVSLAEGFAPTPGAMYTVLTADSVSDLGLSIGGESAGLFRLMVGNDSVSLLATSVPEPSAVALLAVGLAAAGWVRGRRRLRQVKFGEAKLKFNAMRYLSFAAGLLSLVMSSSAWAQPVVEVRRDDFNATHDYTTGTVPAGGIWTGIHSPKNGGDGTAAGCSATGACFVSNGTDFNGTPHPGQLFVEDLALHANPNGSFGIGFEADNPDYNNAPFLHTTFSGTASAQYDFDAVVKIDSQTAGAWSYAGIIVRAAGPPVGISPGDPAFTSAENFITAGSFRTGAVENAEYLLQNVVGGAGANLADYNFDLAPAGATAPVPVWIRLKKRGALFTGDSSTDGVNWFSAPIPPDNDPNFVTNTGLNVTGGTLEVGLAFMLFPQAGAGTLQGSTDFDFFELTLYENPAPTTGNWKVPRGGDWNLPSNWTTTPEGNVPNHNTIAVTFGNVPTTPTTVYTNSAVKMKSLAFNNANKYAISGTGSITLDDALGAPAMNVVAGSHEIQVPVSITANTTITAAAGTRLDFDGQFDFVAASRAVAVSGGGRVNFNNNTDMAVDGVVNVNSGGIVGGTGRINARLNNNAGGTVAPGTSAGTLTVTGQYVQNATGALAIEIGGTAAGTFDKLAVTGLTLLSNGALNVSLINGFVPAPTDMFQILTANLANNTRFGNTTAAPANLLTIAGGGMFTVNYIYGATGSVTLSNFVAPPGGVPGDYNGNNVVDAADYVVWRNTLGTSVPNGTGADGDGNGMIQDNDYTFWRARFGNTSGSGSGSANGAEEVPEPTLIALLLIAAVPWIRMARRQGWPRVFA